MNTNKTMIEKLVTLTMNSAGGRTFKIWVATSSGWEILGEPSFVDNLFVIEEKEIMNGVTRTTYIEPSAVIMARIFWD